MMTIMDAQSKCFEVIFELFGQFTSKIHLDNNIFIFLLKKQLQGVRAAILPAMGSTNLVTGRR